MEKLISLRGRIRRIIMNINGGLDSVLIPKWTYNLARMYVRRDNTQANPRRIYFTTYIMEAYHWDLETTAESIHQFI